jgi:hypothetical protein
MSMIVRSKPSRRSLRGRRSGREAEYIAANGPAAVDLADRVSQITPRGRREGGHSQDRALYTCGCGFAFDALVSTSVGCPHCGSTQAW